MLLLELGGLILFYERWLVSWIRGRNSGRSGSSRSDRCL
jgi:hypothetical protein